MIVRTEVDGKPATVQYLTCDREPTTEEKAEMVYVVFDDGTIMYAFATDDEPETDEPETEDRIVRDDGSYADDV